MKQLQHSNVLKLYGICIKESNLHTYLKIKGNYLQESHLIDMGAQIASGMAYLESKSCIHRNLQLHAKNVYLKTELTQRLICKVTNFSYARFISENNGVKTVPSETFPIKWTAPETLKSGIFTLKSDVWSFGIVLYELVTLDYIPYPGVPNGEVLQRLETGYQMPCPHNCPEKLYKIMLECWRNNTETRPTFETLQWKLEDYYYYYYSDYIDN